MSYKLNPFTGQLDYYESGGYDATTISDPYIDIRAHGAVDGQDSSTAINAAITAAAAGAGNVLIPKGTFIIDATINLASNVRLRGVGPMSILQAKANLDTPVILGTSVSSIAVENFKINGNQTNQTSTAARGIALTGCTNSYVKWMEVTACYGHAILVYGSSSKVSVVDNYIHDTGIADANPPRGIWVLQSSKCIVSRNIVIAANGFGMTFQEAPETIVEDNIIEDSTNYDGMIIYNCNYITVGGNSIKNVYDSGIVFELTNYFTCVGNVIQRAGYVGIYLQGSTYGVVKGNNLKDNGQNAHATYCHDIIFTPSGAVNSTYNIVSGNTCHATAAIKVLYGIHEFNSSQDYNTITNNVCIGQLTAGIKTAGPHTIVKDNTTNDSSFVTFTNADTTPSVARGNFFKCSNSSVTTITNFDDGYAGKEIEIIFTTENTTLNDSGNIVLATTPITPVTNDAFRFKFDGTNWYQVGGGGGGNNVDGGLIGESSTNVNIVDGGTL